MGCRSLQKSGSCYSKFNRRGESKVKKYLLLFVTLLGIVFLAACGTEEEAEPASEEVTEEEETTEEASADAFTIGVIPAQTEGEMAGAMESLQAVLNEAIEQEVSLEVYPDYNGVVEALNYDQIDMAYLGPLTYVIAHAEGGAEAVITQLVDGEPFYHSYIITQADSELESIDDLVANASELDFAFGDPSSTSGALIPSIELQEQGVYESENETDFNSIRFTGSHDATALAVQNGQVDAGAIDSAIYNQLVESGAIDGEQLKVIWESEPLFQYPWAVHPDVEEETVEQLKEAFLAIEDEEILNAFGASGFTEATNEDYESIRQAAIAEGLIEE